MTEHVQVEPRPTETPPRRKKRGGRRLVVSLALLAVLTVAVVLWERPDVTPPSEDGQRVTPTSAPSPDPTVAPTTTEPPPQPRARSSAPALVIKHGWDLPDPAYMRDNPARMEAYGFDGVVFRIDASTDILSPTPVGYDELKRQLEPLASAPLTTLTHNFVIMYTGELSSYGDDWTTPLTNVANLARAADEAGLAGIVYDNEAYFTDMSDWDRDRPEDLDEARRQATTRGREMARAVADNWPDAILLTLIGPWLSDPATAAHYSGEIAYNDVSFANELIGPFFLGMVEVASQTSLELVDGGELYTPRDEAEFEQAYAWMKDGFAAQSALVPEALRSDYGDIVDVGFGVYDRPWLNQPMDDEVWFETLKLAIQRSDEYVWLYTEEHDWWGVGHPRTPVPDSRVEVTRRAIEAAGR